MVTKVDAETATTSTVQSCYLVVSSDSHAGPSLEGDLQPYCPKEYVGQYEDYCREVRALRSAELDEANLTNYERDVRYRLGSNPKQGQFFTSKLAEEARQRTITCKGQSDPQARLSDMDEQGIAAEVIFAGGQNDEVLPFAGFGFDAGPVQQAEELRAVGSHIWNVWLADFVASAPTRLVGVAQIPIYDVPAAVEEIRWARSVGLKAVNLPAPRRDFPSYNSPIYEPLWEACEELDIPLMTHGGGGEQPLGQFDGPGSVALVMCESHWLARRALWQLIFSGVFERHPALKYVLTEQRVAWVPETLRELDAMFYDEVTDDIRRGLSMPPSEYWLRNCFNSGSFLAPFEVAMRDSVGPKNLLWGSDYPHTEGTWPRTRLAMRNTFQGVPEPEVRAILGENALNVFDLDRSELEKVAARIGTTPDEISAFRGHAFRERGSFS
jgi:predicted TIM-barrel fold metal-dependent hydrolase